ncbi:MAG TPA: hypothetical protein VHJ20_00090 [Polyangia bacterium]|nr:hypothetical protein [Polyangia bacterium]
MLITSAPFALTEPYWTRDLYADAKDALWKRDLSPDVAELERLARGDVRDRKIVAVARADGPDSSKVYLGISFSSADFGVVDAANGKFIMLGRD